jgi:hypothetical protein
MSGREWYLWGLVVLGLTLDVATTSYGIHIGLSEGNPLAREVMHLLSPLGAMVLLKAVVLSFGAGVWAVLPRRYRAIVPLGLAVPWLIAGLFNSVVVLWAIA